MNQKPANADLIGSLVGDLAPVRPVRFARVVATTLAIQAVAILATAFALGAGVKGAERLFDPMFVALLVLLGAAAIAGVAATARLAIPGRSVNARVRVGLILLPVALAFAIAVASPWGATWTGLWAVVAEGFGCTRATIVVAVPAWLAALAYLRRLAPLDPVAVGLFSACTSLFGSALVVQMACESCDSWHLALAHYAPIFVAAWLGGLLAAPLLRLR